MMTEILSPSPAHLARAAALIRRGELVAMPTETVYGLAADAMNAEAVAKIFEAKARPSFDPLIVHAPASALDANGGPLVGLSRLGLVELEGIDRRVHRRIDALLKAFWPGALTVVLPRQIRVPDLVTSGLPTVAVRMPSHPIAQALLNASGCVLAAPSANRFGRISPTRAEHVKEELEGKLEMILDGGPCAVGIESTIVSFSNSGDVYLLRPGGVEIDALEANIGVPLEHLAPAHGEAPEAPGMLASHYAPRKPLIMLTGSLDTLDDEALRGALRGVGKVGLLRPTGSVRAARARLQALGASNPVVLSLSEDGDWNEAARNLFESLRRLDASDASTLFVEPAPESPALAFAIGDRLRRASA